MDEPQKIGGNQTPKLPIVAPVKGKKLPKAKGLGPKASVKK